MAKINVMGDALQIKSTLTKAEIERTLTYKPDALKLKDDEGNETFAIGLGNASIGRFGVCFPSTDAEDKVFVTAQHNVDHSDPVAEKEFVIKNFATILDKLDQVETQVALITTELEELETRVSDSIHLDSDAIEAEITVETERGDM